MVLTPPPSTAPPAGTLEKPVQGGTLTALRSAQMLMQRKAAERKKAEAKRQSAKANAKRRTSKTASKTYVRLPKNKTNSVLRTNANQKSASRKNGNGNRKNGNGK